MAIEPAPDDVRPAPGPCGTAPAARPTSPPPTGGRAATASSGRLGCGCAVGLGRVLASVIGNIERETAIHFREYFFVPETTRCRRFFLVAGSSSRQASSDPRLNKLYADKFAIEDKIDALKQRKASMKEDVYYGELEPLLVSLAMLARQIRQLEGR